MEHYKGNLCATDFRGLFITRMSTETHGYIDRLARKMDVGRSAVARCVLEHHVSTNPEGLAEIVSATLGRPKKRAKPTGYPSKRSEMPAIPAERAQDRVCREIHGCVPSGGCRYPDCGCKA